MWEGGNGDESGKRNIIPILKDSQVLEGVAYVVNKGRENAQIFSSNLTIKWMTKKIDMINPMWGAPENLLLDAIGHGTTYSHPALGKKHNLGPSEANIWKFSTVVEGQDRFSGQDAAIFYMFGTIYCRDQTGTQHDLAFTRRSDPSQGRFVRADDATEDTENEDPLPNSTKGN